MQNIMVALPQPVAQGVELLHLWLVHKHITIVVVLFHAILVVQKQVGTQIIVEVQIASGICLYAALAVAKEIYLNSLWLFWFQVLHVYLSCD